MGSRKLRVGLVGCGQIADAHLWAIGTLDTAQLVAVCDHHADLARQAAARFNVLNAYDDVNKMLAAERPDVVHVTTPPRTHKDLALAALAAGAHVYVEKPIALNLHETEQLLAMAESAGRLVCVGHDQLFDPAWMECAALHANGALGQIVHIDSTLGYALDGPFGSLVQADPEHWARRLPGSVFHNTIPHAIYPVVELINDETFSVHAHSYASDRDQSYPTELRVQLQSQTASASIVLSCAMRPLPRLIKVYGTRCSAEVDLDARAVRRSTGLSLRGPFAKIEAPLRIGAQAHRLFWRSIWRFCRNELHYFGGMRNLLRLFYTAILKGHAPPIPYRQIRRVSALIDAVFGACQEPARDTELAPDRPALPETGLVGSNP